MRNAPLFLGLSLFILLIACQSEDTQADTSVPDSATPVDTPVEEKLPSNFLPPAPGNLTHQFTIDITWEKTYESSLRDVKPLRLDGFQGPALAGLVSQNPQVGSNPVFQEGETTEGLLFVQLAREAAESLFSSGLFDRQRHELVNVAADWEISRAGYTFGPQEPIFIFSATEFDEIQSEQADYLIVGSNYYFNEREGLETVYCIRSPEDELPFGPHSFDLLNDSLLILADPLKNRLVLLDKAGKVQMVHKLEFSPGNLQIKRSVNRLEMFDPQEELHYELNTQNFLGPALPLAEQDRREWHDTYKGQEKLELPQRNAGRVTFSRGFSLPQDEVSFQVSPAQGKILSVHSLGRDPKNQKYIVLNMESPDGSLYALVLRYNAENESTGTMRFPFSSQIIYLQNEFRAYQDKIYRLESKDQQYIISRYEFAR